MNALRLETFSYLPELTPGQMQAQIDSILERAARSSTELAEALDTWREIRFEFDTIDTLDRPVHA